MPITTFQIGGRGERNAARIYRHRKAKIRRTVSFMVDVIPQHRLRIVQQGSQLLRVVDTRNDFLQQVGIVAACSLNQELAIGSALVRDRSASWCLRRWAPPCSHCQCGHGGAWSCAGRDRRTSCSSSCSGWLLISAIFLSQLARSHTHTLTTYTTSRLICGCRWRWVRKRDRCEAAVPIPRS